MFGGAHLLAAAALWLAPLPAGWALACSLALLVHLAFALRRHAWLSGAGALVELEVSDDCSVSACSRTGNWERCQIAGSTFVSPALTVLNLRCRAKRERRAVLIASDSLDADSFRRLRVWLRWRWRGGSSVLAGAGSSRVQR